MHPLDHAIQQATELEAARDPGAAARILDAALEAAPEADPALRFRALLLRAELAVTLNDAGGARGILADAFRALRNVDAVARARLSSESRRADDLEAFLTHRGCAG